MRRFLAFCYCLFFGLRAAAEPGITFFAVSDLHYGKTGAARDANREMLPDILNNLPGVPYPVPFGGERVGMPRGVLIPGDLVDKPNLSLWSDYLADYGVMGEGRIGFAVYDGVGNHDLMNASTVILAEFRKRNARRPGLARLDSARFHYSWDWGGVHFVNLNLYAGNLGGSLDWGDPGRGLDFLKSDLAEHVGASGRPVFVMHHYDYRDGWWPESEKQGAVRILRNYNCIGILHGHTHVPKFYRYGGIDIFDDGTAMNGDALVFRIVRGRMQVFHRVRGRWGSLAFEKPVSMGSDGA